MVKEKKIQIGDKEITMNLEELHKKPKKEEGEAAKRRSRGRYLFEA